MSAKTIWTLPCMSQEFNEGPKLRQEPGDQVALAYDFEGETGDYAWEELTFTGVVGVLFTSSRHCSEDQVGAYDRLEDVQESAWSESVFDPPPGLRHFRIYFDDVGCYEVLATGFVPPGTEP